MWANEKLTTEEINNLLLETNDEGRNVLHIVAMCGTPEILQKVWKWANEKLTTEEINLLLERNEEGRNVLHIAAMCGRIDILKYGSGLTRN